ncbi:polar amino acid transport system substrate-binding protein [Saccharothrix ecbatanensis]|uniref:Polar amino acid transport system substrate-binding protein n=1 Tax=Saccharothrix ecbatanensis TaxID=1105145 RepID=A0A7W9HHN2_9PSEU|nr:transporter substrate-binding domain-containing protein [Saccharothrix ecbatanensis]MBB5802116.1 polar amino acid transport system substrate-binding protein [Saccharothrix ecbatanensis]
MRARAAVAALVLLVAGCSGQDAAPAKESTAPLVLPDGYSPTGLPASRVPDCETPSSKDRYNPRITLNPAGLARDASGRPTGATLEKIRTNGLVVGVSQTTPLLSSRNQATGRMEGYEVDIINRVAAELFGAELAVDDRRLRLVTLPTGSRLLALDTGKNIEERGRDPRLAEVPEVDMVVADVTLTCDRVANHDVMYSTPYLTTNAGILSRLGAEPRATLADLTGKKVCAASGTTSIADLKRAQEQGIGIEPVSVPDSSECLMLLQRGLVEAVYTDFPILQGLQLQDPGTRLVHLRGQGGGEAGIAMSNEHPDLVRFVNGVLDEMRDDGTLVASRDRWFVDEVRAAGLDDPGPQPPLPRVPYVD